MSYYDRHKRNPKATAFYKSSQWVKLRNYIFNKRDMGLCQICLEKNKIMNGDVVHHKVELMDGDRGWELRLNESNLITLCHDCHNKIHKRKEQDVVREGLQFDEYGNLVRKDEL